MTLSTKRRFGLIALLTAMSSLAFANAAMGLALEMFEYRTWIVYVLTMIGFEAWLIGTKGGYSWSTSFTISAAANFVTAYCYTSLIGVGLHFFPINPNPLWYVTKLLFFFGIASGFFEGTVWMCFKAKGPVPAPKSRWHKLFQDSVLLRSLVAHIVAVPLALAILLIPSHPYKGLSDLVFYQRRIRLMKVMKSFEFAVQYKGKVPQLTSFSELIKKYAPDDLKSDPDLWTLAYATDYTRFDTGESRRVPWEWNPKVSGLKVGHSNDNGTSLGNIWLCRTYLGGIPQGMILDRDASTIQISFDGTALGLPRNQADR